MRFWRFEINYITPEKETAVVFDPFPTVIETIAVKAPKVAKKTPRTKDENKKPKRTTKAK